ncbi:P-loop containing nucleoside triphosphate hydrolase protein [Tribonema minus]|uniref:P-loop containing nucleoside triphosphate hydrolase protein n=1 Tax=Tribonema minus TaxID=303371 RepID=A0A835YQD8_9STRA|nr:P-loop containing nucleoside triphosphate hydrolase protein [Tribonema minus]
MSTSQGEQQQQQEHAQEEPLAQPPQASSEGDAAASHPAGKKKFQRRRLTTTGGLKGLPIAAPADELLSGAVRRSKKIRQDMEIKNARNRARKWTAERMDTLAKEISKPLRHILDRYNYQIPILHPFEATVADLTVRARASRGERTLQSVLDEVNELRKGALGVGKARAMEAKRLEKRAEILEVMDRGYEDMEFLFKRDGHIVQDLIEIQRQLRSIPVVQLHVPTIVLVGAPNVGKSSIVRTLSTGTPEVNNYPFTTRGMTMGHMFHPVTNQRYQMMDTPGVLSRPDEERNCMEALTLASMQHLPTAVIFVMDLSGYSGEQSTVEKQVEVRNELRKRFPRRPWLDVISKLDLPREGLEFAASSLPEGYLDVSVHDGRGLDELRTHVYDMLQVIESVLFPPPLIDSDGEGEEEGAEPE